MRVHLIHVLLAMLVCICIMVPVLVYVLLGIITAVRWLAYNVHTHAEYVYKTNAYYVSHLHICISRYVCYHVHLICHTNSQGTVHNVWVLVSVQGVPHQMLLLNRYVVNVYIHMYYLRILVLINVLLIIVSMLLMVYACVSRVHSIWNIWVLKNSIISLYCHHLCL